MDVAIVTFYFPQVYDHALGVVKARISKPAPDFTAPAVVNGKFEDITLSSFKGRLGKQ